MGSDRFMPYASGRPASQTITVPSGTMGAANVMMINGVEHNVISGPDGSGMVQVVPSNNLVSRRDLDTPPAALSRQWLPVQELYGPCWVFLEEHAIGWKLIEQVRPTFRRVDGKEKTAIRLIFKHPQRIHTKNQSKEIMLAPGIKVLVVRD